jgi:hypothetical protein
VIQEQFVISSLYREMICVVLVVGSTPRCCAVHQLPRTKRNFIVRPLKPHSTTIARISKISIEFEFQNVRGGFSTVVIVRLFRRLQVYPFVCFPDVFVIAVYCFGVFVIACVHHEVVSSFTFEVVGFACLIHKVVSLLVYFPDVLVIAVYFPIVFVIAIYFYDVLFIAVYFPDVLVIAVYFPDVPDIAVYFPDVIVIALSFFEVVSSIRCDRFSG